MPDDKDDYRRDDQDASQARGTESPQEVLELLKRLVVAVEQMASNRGPALPPLVQQGVDGVTATLKSIDQALALGDTTVVVSGVTPGRGPTSGGTRVTIAGTDFVPGASVAFGGKAATDVSFVSPVEIQATTPDGTIGPVDVVVDTFAGSVTLPRGYTYHY